MLLNLFWSSVSFSFRLLSNVVLFIIIARIYGPKDFGIFSTYVLVGTILYLTSDLGVNQRLFKELSQGEDVSETFYLKKILSLVSFLIAIFISYVFSSIEIIFVASSFIINGILEFYLTSMKSVGKFKYEAFLSLLNNAVFAAIGLGALLIFEDMVFLASGFLLARLLAIALNYFQDREFFYKIFSPAVANRRNCLKKHVFYACDFILTNIWLFLDGVIVRLFYGNLFFGIYSSLSRITNGIGSISLIYTNTIFRSIAQESRRGELKSLYQGTMFLTGAGLIVIMISFCFSDQIVYLLLGEKYSSYSKYLPLLALPVVMKWISSALGIYLVVANLIHKRVLAQLLSLLAFLAIFIMLYTATKDLASVPYSIFGSYVIVLIVYSLVFIKAKNENKDRTSMA